MYHAIYQSSATSQSGCIKEFATIARSATVFPPQVNYHCDLCQATHGFRLLRTVVVATPRQKKAFAEHCARNRIECGVEVPQARA